MSHFNFDSYAKALTTLEIGLDRHTLAINDDLLRDGVIQRFEYCMDLAWKLMQRFLKTELQADESLMRSKKDLFRLAAKMGVIHDAENWIAHYNARNETSHRYNPETAQDVFFQAQLFLPDAQTLLRFFQHATAS